MPDTTNQGVKNVAAGDNAADNKQGDGQQAAGQAGEGGKPAQQPKEAEIIDASKYEPQVRATFKPWSSKEERKQFFVQRKDIQPKKDDGGEDGEGADDGGQKPSRGISEDDVQRLIFEGFEKTFSPVFDHIRSSADEAGVGTFLQNPSNSSFKRFEQLARKDMLAYPNVPIDKIFKALAYDDALARGADIYKQSLKSSKENKVSGRSSRQQSTSEVPDIAAMTDKEFVAYQDKIRMGEIVKVEGEEE